MSEHTGRYEELIGLGMPVQLSTRRKAFCADEIRFVQDANSQICMVSPGHTAKAPLHKLPAPSNLIKVALALNCSDTQDFSITPENSLHPEFPVRCQTINEWNSVFTRGRPTAHAQMEENGPLKLRQLHLRNETDRSVLHPDPDPPSSYPIQAGVSQPDLSPVLHPIRLREPLTAWPKYKGLFATPASAWGIWKREPYSLNISN